MYNDKRLTKIFLFVVISLVGIFILVSSAGAYFYIKTAENRSKSPNAEDISTGSGDVPQEDDLEEEKIPGRTNFAVYGSDSSNLADTIIIFSFDKNEKTIQSISIPRDTYVEIPADRIKELKEKGRLVPSDGMKITEVHSWCGDYGNEYLTKQIEDLLGIKIDYYFEVNVQAFRKIVDDIGGVEIDVPQRMYYNDPTQNLLINLQPGVQKLDGKTAEGFVRFRQYKMGDIDRIEMQKLFIKELAKQAMSKENIVKSATSLVSSFMSYVKTNMDLVDALKYLRYINDIDIEGITMETLPGDNMTPYNHYPEETRILVDKIFYGIDLEGDEEAEQEGEQDQE